MDERAGPTTWQNNRVRMRTTLSADGRDAELELTLGSVQNGVAYSLRIAEKGQPDRRSAGVLRALEDLLIEFRDMRDAFRALECGIAREDHVDFNVSDLERTALVVVHPHRYYDPLGRLTAPVNRLLLDSSLKRIILLERDNEIADVFRGERTTLVDPRLSVRAPRETDFRVAPNGVIGFSPVDEKLPENFIFVGGWFNACVAHAIDYLLRSERRLPVAKLNVFLPTQALLVQDHGDGGDGYPGMPPSTTLTELRSRRPDVYRSLIGQFVRFHARNWNEGLAENDEMGRIEAFDVDGALLARARINGAHSQISFILKP